MDEADQADEVVAHNLSIALAAIRARQNNSSTVDITQVVCGDCSYAGVSFGMLCSDWLECVSDCRKFGVLR